MWSKTSFIAIVILLILVAIAYLINLTKNTIPKELYEKEKKDLNDSLALSRQRESMLKERDSLRAYYIDSLEKKQEKLKQQTEAVRDSIDNILALDSTKALQENRNALSALGIPVSGLPVLTNFEMGWNAKFLNENRGLKTQLSACDEIKDSLRAELHTKDLIIYEKEKQDKYLDSLKTISDMNALTWQKKFEKTQGFFDDRFIFYAGAGVNYNGTNIAPGVQAGIGIRIYTIKFESEE